MKTFSPQRRTLLRALNRPLLPITLMLLFYLAECPGGYAQLTVDQDGATANFSLEVAPLDAYPGWTPFYWTFWIFGDGEYYPPLFREKLPPPAPYYCWENYAKTDPEESGGSWHFSQPHTYFYNSSGFVPLAFSLPRKGDPPPPARASVYSPNGLSGGTGVLIPEATGTFNQVPTIPPGRRIYLAHSHGYLNYHGDEETGIGERSVFVVSYIPPECITPKDSGKVYLFIGQVLTPTGLVRRDHLWFSDPVSPPGRYNPNYYDGHEEDVHREVSVTDLSFPFSRQSVFSFFDDYEGRVRRAITVPMGAPSPFEFRFFQEVQFENPSPAPGGSRQPNLGIDDWSYALTILTSTSRCSLTNNAVLSFLKGIPGVNTLGDGFHTYNGEYIIDADFMYLKSGEPHDPNRLYVTRYCDSLLTASLTLSFCNLPTATATAEGAEINFRIIDPNFTWCRLNRIRDQDGASVNWEKCRLPCIKRYFFPDNNYYNCGNRHIYYNDLNLPAGSSAEIDVVIKAIADTIQLSDGRRYHFLDYLKHYQVLEASVRFDGPEETTITRKNELLESPAIWQIRNEPLIECVLCEDPCFSIRDFIIPAILVVALIGFFWQRRRILRARNRA